MPSMREYRRSSHTVYQIHYHFVFTTKYRKPVLRGDVAQKVRDLIRDICRAMDVEILSGHVRPDHIHVLLSVPPHLAPSQVMQAIKGKTSNRLLMNWRELRPLPEKMKFVQYWKRLSSCSGWVIWAAE